MNIYQRINAVMKEVSYIQKDKHVTAPGQNYKAVTHDNVTAMVRPLLVKHGIVVRPSQINSEIITKRDVKNDIKMNHYSGDYIVSFVNMDDPKDFADVVINAHATDSADKMPGKAISYATKYAMLKILSLETGDDEESREFAGKEYNEMQKKTFDSLIEEEDATGLAAFVQSVGQNVFIALFNSFEAGSKTRLKNVCRELEKKGHEQIRQYAEQISDLLAKEDPYIKELVSELTREEKYLVAKYLTPEEIEMLKGASQ